MATASEARPKAIKGFKVRCPHCVAEEGTVRLDLNDLGGAEACRCSECDAEFSVREAVALVSEQLQRWQAIAAWIEAAGGFAGE